jgi:hypothetical protein
VSGEGVYVMLGNDWYGCKVLSLAMVMTCIPDAGRTIEFDGVQEIKRVLPASSMTIR